MIKVGTIKEIWRYPVKGMAGERIDSCQIGKNGLNGDRQYAVRDITRNEIQSCKFRPELLSCVARSKNPEAVFNHQAFEILFPDGTALPWNSNEINSRISDVLGHESSLEAVRPASETDFYRRYKADDHNWLRELKDTFMREPGEALPDFSKPSQDFIDYVTLPGTFFLVSPCHIITTATMQHFKQLQPEADWDIRRFRPNIVVETVPDSSGLVEQQWLDKTLHIAETTINCSSTAPRCGAVTRKQQRLEFDKSMLRTIVKDAEQNLGIYGDITGQTLLHAGDEVYLSE